MRTLNNVTLCGQFLSYCPLSIISCGKNIVFRERLMYWSADKSLARPGSKQANLSARMASISFGALPCRKKKLDNSSRLDVVEIARVPDMLPSLFPSWSG